MLARGADGRSRTAFEPPMLTVSSAFMASVFDNSSAMAEAASMNGAELAERARELRPEMPIVYASGRYKLSEISPLVPRSLFVAKPYDPNDICALLTRLTGGSGAPA